jgi:nucleoside-diphosphate kinase
METTLVIIKPSAVHRQLIGEVIARFERKGLKLVAIKMAQLSDEILAEHYPHLTQKSFYHNIKNSMQSSPVVLCAWQGVDAVHTVHTMAGATLGREAAPGTIRGDLSMSVQKNIVHTSDTPENALIELKRFFKDDEFFDYTRLLDSEFYAPDEV